MDDLKITLAQIDIVWEDPNANIKKIDDLLSGLMGMTDLVILPEMFSTGFSMNSSRFAESNDGQTIAGLKTIANKNGFAIVGSFIAKENGKHYNRAFFISPNDEPAYYDKRHLFRMGDEVNHYFAGVERKIVAYKGWNICLMICYDLRFPVWSRNVNNEYDLLIYVANWPEVRSGVWDILLRARAIENMAYVCGVNRVGIDGLGLKYIGNSTLLNARGEALLTIENGLESIQSGTISKQALQQFRMKFPVWKDGDRFHIEL